MRNIFVNAQSPFSQLPPVHTGRVMTAAYDFTAPATGAAVNPAALNSMQKVAREWGCELTHDPSADAVTIVSAVSKKRVWEMSRADFRQSMREFFDATLRGISITKFPRDAVNEEGLGDIKLPDFVEAGLLTFGVVQKYEAALENDKPGWKRSARKFWDGVINPEPKPRHREFKNFWNQTLYAGETLATAPFTGVLQCVGQTGTALIRMPQIVKEAYHATWATKHIGPNLKTLISVTIPVAAVFIPPFIALGSLLYGAGRGTQSVFSDYSWVGAHRIALNDIDVAWRLLKGENLSRMRKEITGNVRPGDEPFDIKVLQAGRGLVTSLTSAAIQAPLIGAMALYRMPKAYVKVMDMIWGRDSDRDLMMPIKGALTLLAIPAIPLAVALCPVVGALTGVVEGAYRGYSKGFRSATRKAHSNARDFWNTSHKVLKLDS